MLAIKNSDVVNGIYQGREPRLEDVVIIPAGMRKIIFRGGLDVKGIMSGADSLIVCEGPTKMRHAQIGGAILFTSNVFCGAMESTGLIISQGDIVSWMGDIISKHSSIIAMGEVRSSGKLMARNGAIVSMEGMEAEDKIFSLNTWTPKSGEPRSGLAEIAFKEAERLIGSVLEKGSDVGPLTHDTGDMGGFFELPPIPRRGTRS